MNRTGQEDDQQPLGATFLTDTLLSMGIKPTQKIAIAVSGGADSMGLAILSRHWLKQDGGDVVALIVDHQLRSESADEANLAQERLQALGLESHILSWSHAADVQGNLQAVARDERYQLMINWCADHEIKYLLTAHHKDDQAETFLLRLARGSGVYGLAGMAEKRVLDGNVTLVRPLLDTTKQRLIATCLEASVDWIEDPSNQNMDFDRVKVREVLAKGHLPGLSSQRLAETAGRMRRTRQAIEYYERHWLERSVEFHEAGFAYLNVSMLTQEPKEITLRGLASLIRFAGGGMYVPRFERLERLWIAIQQTDFRGATLGGAQFSAAPGDRLMVHREVSAVAPNAFVSKTDVWDNRFCLEPWQSEADEALEVGALGEAGLDIVRQQIDVSDLLPRDVALTTPAFFQAESLIAAPYLGYDIGNEDLPVLSHRWLPWSKTG